MSGLSRSASPLDDQREDILRAFPQTRTLISFVVRMNREAIRTPARSISNTEFHHSGDEVDEIGRSVVQTLEDRGIGAIDWAMGFPMEMDQFPARSGSCPTSVSSGGRAGNDGHSPQLIHEKFGNYPVGDHLAGCRSF